MTDFNIADSSTGGATFSVAEAEKLAEYKIPSTRTTSHEVPQETPDSD